MQRMDNRPQTDSFMEQLQDNALIFWAGLVLAFLGFLFLIYSLFIITRHPRLLHSILGVVIILAGAVVASFARPRTSSTISGTTR
jgi:cytochrome c biogenesis protein CcdA